MHYEGWFSTQSCIKRPVNTVSAKLVLPKLTHTQIAILANCYSVDVIVRIVWGKNGKFHLAFLEFPWLKFHKIGRRVCYDCFALGGARFSGKSVRPVRKKWEKIQICK